MTRADLPFETRTGEYCGYEEMLKKDQKKKPFGGIEIQQQRQKKKRRRGGSETEERSKEANATRS